MMTRTKKFSKIRRNALAACAVAALMIPLGATVASADATGGKGCPGGAQVLGTYRTANGAYTTEFLDCGQLKVRIMYRAYPGGPVYYTAYTYSATNAVRANPGGQIASHHGGSSADFNYFYLSD